MSQVIVTSDEFSKDREVSRGQEHRIVKEAQFVRWYKSDISKPGLALRVIGFLAIPIALFWGLLLTLLGIALYLNIALLRGLAAIFGGSSAKKH